MTLSRTTALTLALCFGGCAQAADTVTAEEATANYRRMFPPIDTLDCPQGTAGEVVVCGRSDRPGPRLPLPQGPPEGQRVAGNIPSPGEVVERRDRCSTVGPNQQCSGGLPVAPAAIFLGKVLKKIFVGD
jgi:hypothetical protein